MPAQDWSHLGAAIRQSRRREGMSQADLAAASGLGTRTIGNYERGRIPESAPVIPDGYFDVARVLKWSSDSVEKVLAGGEPAFNGEGMDDDSVQGYVDSALGLADAAKEMGAPAEIIDRYRSAAVSLIGWMAHKAPQPRDDFRLAAYRPQALGEGVPRDDAERIMTALEDDK